MDDMIIIAYIQGRVIKAIKMYFLIFLDMFNSMKQFNTTNLIGS